MLAARLAGPSERPI